MSYAYTFLRDDSRIDEAFATVDHIRREGVELSVERDSVNAAGPRERVTPNIGRAINANFHAIRDAIRAEQEVTALFARARARKTTTASSTVTRARSAA